MTQTIFAEPTGFNQLSKADQIRYVQMLWDKIATNPEDVPIPDSHWLELRDRLAEYRASPEDTKPARDVLDRLADTRRK